MHHPGVVGVSKIMAVGAIGLVAGLAEWRRQNRRPVDKARLETRSTGAMTTSAGGVVEWSNPAMKQLTGLTLVGQPIAHFVERFEASPQAEGVRAALANHSTVRASMRWQRPDDGEMLRLLVEVQPLSDRSPAGAVLVIDDHTREFEMHDEIDRTRLQMNSFVEHAPTNASAVSRRA